MLIMTKELIYNNLTKIIYSDKTYYCGQVEGDIRNGYGKYYNSDKEIIGAGEWVDDDLIKSMSVDDVNKILDELC